MKPFDLRLVRYARNIISTLTVGGVLGVIRAAAIVVWAWAIAHLTVWVVRPVLSFDWAVNDQGRVFEGFEPLPLRWSLLAGLALVVRFASNWMMSVVSERGAVKAKQQLRKRALDHTVKLGPQWVEQQSQAEMTLKLGRGLDELDEYFAQYLPQLILTLTVTPLLTLTLWLVHPLSGLIVLIVFPIIPIFMVLIGLATQGAQEKQWKALTKLSDAYLDLVRGLPTLKLFGREQLQPQRVRNLTESYHSRTMKVLRVTFLSGFVLDLAGTFSVALVAVTVGTQLVTGGFPLASAMFVLLLVPEIFIPVRQVGAAFHASVDGLTAAQDVFKILESPLPPRGHITPLSGVHLLQLDRVIPSSRGEIQPVSLQVDAGEIVALSGPSGVGKTSLMNTIVGVGCYSGSLAAAPNAWAGQRPGLLQGTVGANITLGIQETDPYTLAWALDATQLSHIHPETVLGPLGQGISGGQAQRVALARALYHSRMTGARLLLLDEPTSALDAATEAYVMGKLRALAQEGYGILIASHRQAVLQEADRIITMRREITEHVHS